MLGAASCTREEPQDISNGGIVVKLNVDDMPTKAENTILAGYIYLFDNVDAAPYKTIDIDESGTKVLDFDAGLLKRTTVFAVTGYPLVPSPASLSDLKSRPVGASSFLDASGTKVKATPSFIMTGEGHFEKVDDTHTTCTLTLKRLAAKVTLELAYTSPIKTDGTWEFKAGTPLPSKTTWTPMTSGENIRVYLQNAVNVAVLGGASTQYPASFSTFTYDQTYMNGASVSSPFYTYPVKWAKGSSSEPFIKLIQPWRYKTTVEKDGKDVVVDENIVELYYKIMLPDITTLDANTWYQPKVTLNILGGEANRPTVIGADGLTIMNWRGVESSEMPAVTINPSDFLVPERETFEVSNGNPLQIKYFASGDVNFTVKEIYKDVYTNNDTERRYIYSTYPGHTYLYSTPIQDTDAVKDRYNREFSGKDDKTGTETDWFTNSAFDTDTKSGILTLNHTLSDDFDLPNFAARPYHYEVELSLKDNSSVKKTITIIQNPPVLVDGKKSTGLVYVNEFTSDFGTLYKARKTSTETPKVTSNKAKVASGIFINSNAYSPNELGEVNTYAYLASNANNCSEYRIEINVAPSDGLFITDPRIDLSGYSASSEGNGLYGIVNMHRTGGGYATDSGVTFNNTGSPLSTNSSERSSIKAYYKPTKKYDATGKSSTEYLPDISPSYMVASSYGKDGRMTYEAAVLRCVAYQEDGYPAGRWRLPTEAEIEYAIKLNDKQAIPNLFYAKATNGVDVGYIASSGRTKKFTGKWETVAEGGFVRCVYDTWYWGDEEVADGLKTADFGTTSKKQYNWSGYQEKYMNKYYTPAP